MKPPPPHVHAKKVIERLEAAQIQELGRDEHGNPWIMAADLPKLHKSLHSTLERCGAHRICLRLYKSHE